MSTSGRQLLLAAVKGHRRVEAALQGFLELGLPGATVVDAKGMGQIVSSELPIFSGFRSLFPGGGEESYLVLSVLTTEQVEEAVRKMTSATASLYGLGDRGALVPGKKGDVNGNGRPDACDLAFGDLDLDGCIGGGDLGLLLLDWGRFGDLPGNLDYPAWDYSGDVVLNAVDGADLGLLLKRWGQCP